MVFKSLTPAGGRGAGGKEGWKLANLGPLLVDANIFVSGVRKGFSSSLDLWMCLRGSEVLKETNQWRICVSLHQFGPKNLRSRL